MIPLIWNWLVTELIIWMTILFLHHEGKFSSIAQLHDSVLQKTRHTVRFPDLMPYPGEQSQL